MTIEKYSDGYLIRYKVNGQDVLEPRGYDNGGYESATEAADRASLKADNPEITREDYTDTDLTVREILGNE